MSASIASCATTSVSGRGTNTPGPTRSSRWRKGATPVMCCSGSRAARRTIELLERCRGRGVERVAAHHGRLHRAAAEAEHVPGQQLGVDQRIGHAGARQLLRGAAEHGGEDGGIDRVRP